MRNAMLGTIMFVIATLCFMAPSYVQAAGDDKTTMEDVKQETQDLISKLKGYAANQRDEAILHTEQALKKMDDRIEALETAKSTGSFLFCLYTNLRSVYT